MSRSRKKYSVAKDNTRSAKWWKRQANKKVRNSSPMSGGDYKRWYCSWNIHDYVAQVWDHEKDAYPDWYMLFRRK